MVVWMAVVISLSMIKSGVFSLILKRPKPIPGAPLHHAVMNYFLHYLAVYLTSYLYWGENDCVRS
jgi:hypothetical protein